MNGAPSPALVLVSHLLCPYVQRVAIVLAEKGVAFERRDVDLADKPEWFMKISPMGRTPVLLVGEHAIFESAVICEYLDDTILPRLHPDDPLHRARHRAWIEFASSLLAGIGKLYSASDETALLVSAADLRRCFEQLEQVLHAGPFFEVDFGLVDAAFAPAFRYFESFDASADLGLWQGLPKLCTWRSNLLARASVAGAVSPHYRQYLEEFVAKRGGALAHRMEIGTGNIEIGPINMAHEINGSA